MTFFTIPYRGKTKTGTEILIRYPRRSDLDAAWRYINAVSKEKTFVSVQGESISRKSEAEYLKSLLKKIAEKREVALWAFRNGRLIGTSSISIGDKIRKHIGKFGIIIAKDFRGQGIGSFLMRIVLREAKKKFPRLKIVTLGVFANNQIARKMYAKFGFREYGKLPKGFTTARGYVDHIYMYTRLRPRK